MRFDYFEFFWERFGDKLQSYDIEKEAARSFYDYNFSTFSINQEQTTEEVIYFKDETDETNYYCILEDDCVVIIRDSVYIQGVEVASFGKDGIGLLAENDDGIRVESYSSKTGSLNVLFYDNDVENFIAKDEGYFEYDDANVFHSFTQALRKMHLLPDIAINIALESIKCENIGAVPQYVCRVETFEGEEIVPVFYNDRVKKSYTTLKKAANDILQKYIKDPQKVYLKK